MWKFREDPKVSTKVPWDTGDNGLAMGEPSQEEEWGVKGSDDPNLHEHQEAKGTAGPRGG